MSRGHATGMETEAKCHPSTCSGLEGRPMSLTISIKPPLLPLSQAGRPPLHRLGEPPPHVTSSGEAHTHAHFSRFQFLLEMFSDVYFSRGMGRAEGS